MKFDVQEFSQILLRKFKFHSNLTRITVTLRKDPHTYKIIYRRFLRISNVSDKVVVKIETQIYVQ
jgi:hypothetical protein